MKKSWIVTALALITAGGAVYQLVSNKAHIESELAARKHLSVTVPVTVQTIKAGALSHQFSVDGTVGAENEVVVLAETGGQVLKVLVEVGQRVSKGTPLVRLDSKVVESQLATAQVSLANAERDLERTLNLLKSGASTQQNADQMRLAVENARASLVSLEKLKADALVCSPVDGTVTARQTQEGSVLAAGSPVVAIADLSSLVLRVGLTEKELTAVRPGTTVSTTFAGKEIQARVGTVGVSADQAGRYPVELRLPASHSELKMGVSGSAHFQAESVSELPVIPRQTLVAGIKDPKVYVIEGNKARLRKVSAALASGDKIAISAGLKDGEQVVLTGQLNLADGSVVQVIR